MYGFRRPSPSFIQREIQYLTRAFPARWVVIYRETPQWSSKGVKVQNPPRTLVYRGEAIYIPAGGQVQLFGGGQTERTSPTLIVVGLRDIRQGDFVDLDGQKFQVNFPQNHHGHFVEIRLDEFQTTPTP